MKKMSKMRTLIALSVPVKAFASMIFSGTMILYMVSGFMYTTITGEVFDYAIPFVFVAQGAILSMVISILWGIFLSDVLIKKWRFAKRCIMFKLSLIPLLALCFFTFLAIPMEWTIPWFIAVVVVSIFVVVLAVLSEIYYKKTGAHYTEALKQYKERTTH